MKKDDRAEVHAGERRVSRPPHVRAFILETGGARTKEPSPPIPL